MLKASTFARRPAAAAAGVPSVASAPPAVNPAYMTGAALAALLASGVLLIALLGDPHAGAPSVKVSLERKPPPDAALGALRTRLGLDGAAPAAAPPGPGLPARDPLAAQITAGGAPPLGAAPPSGVDGEAIITLPQGGFLGGAAPSPSEPRSAPRSGASPLPVAPIVGLYAPSPQGNLPVVGKDGRTPFTAYSRPFHDTGKPKVALVLGGLGLNAAATRAAIERLPPEITLSFVPYAEGLQGWIDQARANGHEVLLEIPMEPLDYPNNDPGPSTLMAGGSREEMTRRLEWLLARASGYFGVTNYLGGRFMTVDAAMNAFTGALKARGLAFVDDGSAGRRGGGVPRASADHVIDEQLSADAIDRQLNELATSAQQRGQALGAGFAYPVTLTQVAKWAQGLQARGLQLAPASALATLRK